jgi:MFS transporter, FHS family, L-fucose permease
MNQQNYRYSVFILGTLFFIFGFVTWLNNTLIVYFHVICELTPSQSTLVTFAFYISYFVTALPSSWVLKHTGYKHGMMLGLLIMAAGALMFIPAALTRNYSLFLLGLFIIGTGLSLLQTASNPYITIIGPHESAAKRISIMGICNKAAGAIGQFVLATILLAGADNIVKQLQTMNVADKTLELNELAARVILPYAIMAAVLAALSLMIYLSSLPEIKNEEGDTTINALVTPHNNVFGFPNLVLGVIAIFVYVGVEVLAGDYISLYGKSMGYSISISKYLGVYTLVAMGIGYIIGILSIPKFIKQHNALTISSIVAIIFSLVIVLSAGYTSILFIALLGLANAIMWPAIWPLAIKGLGKFTKTGSALLIMAIVGGGIIPRIFGQLAEVPSIGYQRAYWILVPCYLFILFYSVKGHRIKNWA